MGRVQQQSSLQNLELAFSVAETELGVTRLLDPEGTASMGQDVGRDVGGMWGR